MLEYALLVAFVIIMLIYKDLQKLYQDYQLISNRLSAMEQHINSAKSTTATQTDSQQEIIIKQSHTSHANYNTLQDPSSNTESRCITENTQPPLRCESQQIIANKEENKEEIKESAENNPEEGYGKNQNSEAEANYSKTYYNLMSLSKDTKMETPITKCIGSSDIKGDDSNESIEKLTKMKKIGLQDMTINKISKMIQNHSQIKDEKEQKPFSNPMLSYKKINDRKSSLDKRSEPKSVNLNIGYFRPSLNSSTTSKHKEVLAFDTSRTTREEEEKHKKEKELIVMRRAKAKQYSEQGRKLVGYKKD